ncbi:LON peptidase N-terminal domain and RING finger protein 3 isoform X2 [Procambarus clarkii]|uniref:LON peptidase N-terminal domain and RING finger protein 3 isoform X2 n=1 Tax=Procambarus clarkii TaxID=6728 RepID=UPI0037435B0F
MLLQFRKRPLYLCNLYFKSATIHRLVIKGESPPVRHFCHVLPYGFKTYNGTRTTTASHSVIYNKEQPVPNRSHVPSSPPSANSGATFPPHLPSGDPEERTDSSEKLDAWQPVEGKRKRRMRRKENGRGLTEASPPPLPQTSSTAPQQQRTQPLATGPEFGNSPFECKVCYVDFDDCERRPRNLPCGHAFCTRCIASTIRKNSLLCPACRLRYACTAATQFPISYMAEELMKSLRENHRPSTAGSEPPRDSQKVIEMRLEHLRREQKNIIRSKIVDLEKTRSQLDEREKLLNNLKKDYVDLMAKLNRVTIDTLADLENDHRSLKNLREEGVNKRLLEAMLEHDSAEFNKAREIGAAIDEAKIIDQQVSCWTRRCQLVPNVNTVCTALKVHHAMASALGAMKR